MTEQQAQVRQQRDDGGVIGRFARGVFDAANSGCVLMDPQLTILAVNASFTQATGMSAEYLVGRGAFEAFPTNPQQEAENPTGSVRSSLERVVRTGQRDTMFIQRYDIPDPTIPGEFLVRYWSPVNSPVFDERGDLVGVLHQVEDVTEQREELVRIFGYLSEESDGGAVQSRRLASYATTAMAHSNLYRSAQSEVDQLREALTSRAVIDQAKGILMGEHRCTAEEAFSRLKQMSNDTNVRLRDVASALIYQTTAPARQDPSVQEASRP